MLEPVSAIADKVIAISEQIQLTQDELGEIVGSSSKAVSRWRKGISVPQREARQRLLELAYVANTLSGVLRPEDANLWIFSPNALLDHDSPADRIRTGDYKTVLALIEALADGVAV